MAITLRPSESQDKELLVFMDNQGYATKNKALAWLMENANRLVENDKIMGEMIKAEKLLAETKSKLMKAKTTF